MIDYEKFLVYKPRVLAFFAGGFTPIALTVFALTLASLGVEPVTRFFMEGIGFLLLYGFLGISGGYYVSLSTRHSENNHVNDFMAGFFITLIILVLALTEPPTLAYPVSLLLFFIIVLLASRSGLLLSRNLETFLLFLSKWVSALLFFAYASITYITPITNIVFGIQPSVEASLVLSMVYVFSLMLLLRILTKHQAIKLVWRQ